MRPNLSIIICTEMGPLENMAKLLVWSIREFGGSFANVPIYSFQPRKKFPISRSTSDFFDKNEVSQVNLDLNQNHQNYPLANKPIACAYAEEALSSEFIVFLDTDVFICSEPSEFIISGDFDVALRPVDVKNIGSEGEGDQNNPYWKELFKLLQMKDSPFVTTTVDKRKIYAYYNSGHIISKRHTRLFSKWNENFEKVMRERLQPAEGVYFVEQSVFSATVSQLELQTKLLGKSYNYPIHCQKNFVDENEKVFFIKDMTSVHYHKIFDNFLLRNPLSDFVGRGTDLIGSGILRRAKNYGVIPSFGQRLAKYILR